MAQDPTGGTGGRPATWADLARHEARKARVPPQLALAVMGQESGGNPDARSEVGAQGLFQLMPETAKGLGIDPSDPLQNIRGGVTYLRQALDAVGGDVSKALAYYHGGPDLKIHGPKTAAYVQSVLGRLQGGAGGPVPAPAAGSSPPPTAPPGAPPTVDSGKPPTGFAVGQPPPPITSIPLADPLKSIKRPAGPVAGLEPGKGAGGQLTLSPRTDQTFTEALVSAVDPRTAEGRRNIAGGTGALAAGLVTGGIAAPIVGAIAGGMTAESTEQAVGNKPPSSLAVVGRGAEQGAYDAGGQLALWPLRVVGKRVLGSRVGRYAAEALSSANQAVKDQTAAALDAARSMVRGARGVRDTAIDTARAGVEASRTAKTGAIAGAKAQTAKDVAGLEGQLQGVIGGPPPSPSAAGRTANAVIQGPARSAREIAGNAVEEAAQSGPPVNLAALKEEARRILETEIKPSAEAFPRGAPPDPEQTLMDVATNFGGMSINFARDMMAADPTKNLLAADLQRAVAKAQAEAAQTTLKHPAMGVISRILNAEDDVPFAAAHAFKRELDEAVGTAWDRSVSKRVTNITKKLRTDLRAALDYGPYNAATEKYAQIAPLYTKEIAPKLRKLAETRPEALIDMLKGNQPTPARMLREVLTTQAAEGGDAAGGQAAWDLVRSTWASEKLLRPGLDKLDDTLAKLDPEFLDVMFGDSSGKGVLANIRTIATGYRQALAREPQAIAGARAGYEVARSQGAQDIRAARTAFQGAQTAGEAAIDTARTQRRVDLNQLREQAIRLGKSSVAARGVSEEFWADLGRALMVPKTFWGARSIARLVLRTPNSADLIEWAAFSPANTQRLVAAFTSAKPGEAVGQLLRQLSTPAKQAVVGSRPSSSPQVGTPPPR